MEVFIFIPTYNEAENIEKLINQLISLYPRYNIIVVDDSSPDGTGNIVRKISETFKNVYVFNREEDRGRGYAGIFGFKKSLELGADVVIEMDGDLSHSPSYINDFIKELKNYSVVIGSRYVKGGNDVERNLLRKIISFTARSYIKLLLGLNIKDPTSGFRAFRKEVLDKITPRLKSTDPFIVTEVLYHCKLNGFNISEIPISFNERYRGKSKLNFNILFSYLFKVIKLKIST